MPQTIAQKLRIREHDTLFLLHPPDNFQQTLSGLPEGVKFTSTGKMMNQVHWFVRNTAQLEKEMSKVLGMLKDNTLVWVYYPKGGSGIQIDLTRDKGWHCLMREKDRLTWLTLISFDKTWSVFGFRPKTAEDRKKEARPKEREIFEWIDPKQKIVRIPDDLAAAFQQNKAAQKVFDALAFSHRKEYVEWIVSAKKEETRANRITGTIERLTNGWKNPRNI